MEKEFNTQNVKKLTYKNLHNDLFKNLLHCDNRNRIPTFLMLQSKYQVDLSDCFKAEIEFLQIKELLDAFEDSNQPKSTLTILKIYEKVRKMLQQKPILSDEGEKELKNAFHSLDLIPLHEIQL